MKIIELVCSGCLNIFSKSLREYKKCIYKGYKNFYCSKKCYYTFIKVDRTLICENCHLPFEYVEKSQKYCSHSCASIQINKSRVTKTSFCNSCLKSKSKSYSLLCKQCKNKNKYLDYIDNWKKGLVSGNVCTNEAINTYIRKYMFDKYKNRCHLCGWCEINKVTKKIPLQINHIDGDSSNSTEDNLELICPNCHSLTHNYGSLNKGKGRPSRRKN